MSKITKKEEQEILSRFAQYLKDKQDGKHYLSDWAMISVAWVGTFIGILLYKLIEWL